MRDRLDPRPVRATPTDPLIEQCRQLREHSRALREESRRLRARFREVWDWASRAARLATHGE